MQVVFPIKLLKIFEPVLVLCIYMTLIRRFQGAQFPNVVSLSNFTTIGLH